MRRIAAFVAAIGLTAALVTPVAAHSHTVDPNGNGEGFTKPVSKPWAQAHCNAQSPEVLAEVNAASWFNPAAALPCPAVENPGGQVHPD